MPEGDTIFRAATTLRRALEGKVVQRFECVYAPVEALARATPVVGRTVSAVEARGKHLLMTFRQVERAHDTNETGALVLRTHMRMNGSWHIYRPGERWRRPAHALRVRLDVPDFVAVGFDVPEAELLTETGLRRHQRLNRLGPDLLAPDFAARLDEARGRVQAAAARPIAEVLLDQSVIAGLGNVYKSEVLFLHGIHPRRPTASLEAPTVTALLETAARLLRLNAGIFAPDAPAGADRGMRRTTGRLQPDERLWVYGRGGQPCRRCGTPIVRELAADGRSTYHCPRCQPA